MGRVNNSEFLKQFGGFLEENKGKSSVYVTQKRLSPALDLDDAKTENISGETSITKNIKDLPSKVISNDGKYEINEIEYPVLIRISINGDKSKNKKIKLSTVVETSQLEQFWGNYAQVVKSGFIGLKKKDKKKNKKGKVSK